MNTPVPTYRRSKRPYSSILCRRSPSASSLSSDDDDDVRPQKRLALSISRLSLSSTPNPGLASHDVEMRQRKSYQKDAFTTVIESLSTTTSDIDSSDDGRAGADSGGKANSEAPFTRDESHVTIISEIEKRLTQFPHTLLSPAPSASDTALVLYRSPESMGLPPLERQKQEDMKAATRKRIQERRRMEMEKSTIERDGYEADSEDWGSSSPSPSQPAQPPILQLQPSRLNGFHYDMNYRVNKEDDDDDDDDGDMMDLD